MIEKLINEFTKIISGKSNVNLRFGKTYVTVSEIAQQFYCEEKLNILYREGKIQTLELELGELIHEEFFKGKEISIEDLLQKIEEVEKIVVTFPICTIVNEIPIIGIPDAIILNKSKVIGVVELKTSNKWLYKIFKPEYVQIQTYAYILKKWNLLSKDVKLFLVKIKRDVELTKALRNEIFNKILLLVNKIFYESTIITQNYVIHVLNFDYGIESCIKWALKFWTMERKEYISKNPNKCKSCEFRHLCSKKLC